MGEAGGRVARLGPIAPDELPFDHFAASSSRFEELDGIPIGILDLDLAAAGTRFHVVAETKSETVE